MKSKVSNKHKEMEELLESDDELPENYVETPYVPAYQNDNRFMNSNFNLMDIKKKLGLVHLTPNNNNPIDRKSTKLQSDKILKKGIMNKKDIFLSECIATHDDTTLIWFVNYLMIQDLQSNYRFLTSCLVPNTCFENNTNYCKIHMENIRKQRYKIVVRD